MTSEDGFGVVGCPKCRRIMAADLSYETKTCQCGHTIKLRSARILCRCPTGESAANAVRELQKEHNTGFAPATGAAAAVKNGLCSDRD